MDNQPSRFLSAIAKDKTNLNETHILSLLYFLSHDQLNKHDTIETFYDFENRKPILNYKSNVHLSSSSKALIDLGFHMFYWTDLRCDVMACLSKLDHKNIKFAITGIELYFVSSSLHYLKWANKLKVSN